MSANFAELFDGGFEVVDDFRRENIRSGAVIISPRSLYSAHCWSWDREDFNIPGRLKCGLQFDSD
jgi:hypothetical protein